MEISLDTMPQMLVKNVDPFQLEVQTYDGKKVAITTDIKHAGGSILDPTGARHPKVPLRARRRHRGTVPARAPVEWDLSRRRSRRRASRR